MSKCLVPISVRRRTGVRRYTQALHMTNEQQPRRSKGVNRFCEDHETSRSQLYKLWKEGRGPRFYYNGNQRRITDEAEAEWLRAMESATLANH